MVKINIIEIPEKIEIEGVIVRIKSDKAYIHSVEVAIKLEKQNKANGIQEQPAKMRNTKNTKKPKVSRSVWLVRK